MLRPGGRLYASTIGREHMRELDAWAREFGLAPLDGIGLNEMVAGRFGLETGEAKLAPWFQPITLHKYEDSLRVTEAGPLMAYILSSIPASEAALAADKLAAYARFVENELAEKGSLHITKASGLFEAAPSGDTEGEAYEAIGFRSDRRHRPPDRRAGAGAGPSGDRVRAPTHGVGDAARKSGGRARGRAGQGGRAQSHARPRCGDLGAGHARWAAHAARNHAQYPRRDGRSTASADRFGSARSGPATASTR